MMKTGTDLFFHLFLKTGTDLFSMGERSKVWAGVPPSRPVLSIAIGD